MPLALDPLIHQETRLRIVALLAGLGEGAKAEFTWLRSLNLAVAVGVAAYEAYRKALLDLLQGR